MRRYQSAKPTVLNKILPDLLPKILEYYVAQPININFMFGLGNLSVVLTNMKPLTDNYLKVNKQNIVNASKDIHNKNNPRYWYLDTDNVWKYPKCEICKDYEMRGIGIKKYHTELFVCWRCSKHCDYAKSLECSVCESRFTTSSVVCQICSDNDNSMNAKHFVDDRIESIKMCKKCHHYLKDTDIFLKK